MEEKTKLPDIDSDIGISCGDNDSVIFDVAFPMVNLRRIMNNKKKTTSLENLGMLKLT